MSFMEEEVPLLRGKKRLIADISGHNELGVYKFKILLPNSTTVGLTLHEHTLSNLQMSVQEFIGLVRTEYFRNHLQIESPDKRQKIMWKSKDLYIEDISEKRMYHSIDLRNFQPHKCHILQLNVSSCCSFLCT